MFFFYDIDKICCRLVETEYHVLYGLWIHQHYQQSLQLVQIIILNSRFEERLLDHRQMFIYMSGWEGKEKYR